MHDIWDSEGVALEAYARAKIDPSEPTGPAALARGLLHRHCIRYVDPWRLVGHAALARIEGVPFIYVRRGLPAPCETFAIAHECAEYMLRGESDERIEEAADRAAAAIVAPRPAFASVLRQFGPSPKKLAKAFQASQSLVVMRVAETRGTPTLLRRPGRLRVRGDVYGWPEQESDLWGLTEPRVRLPRGLRKCPITDDRGRVAVVAT